MDDNAAVVDQNPFAFDHAFDSNGKKPSVVLDLQFQVIGNGLHLPCGSTVADNQAVRVGAEVLDVQYHQALCLFFLYQVCRELIKRQGGLRNLTFPFLFC